MHANDCISRKREVTTYYHFINNVFLCENKSRNTATMDRFRSLQCQINIAQHIYNSLSVYAPCSLSEIVDKNY